MNKYTVIILLIGAVVVGAVILSNSINPSTSEREGTEKDFDLLATLSLTDYEGNSISLSEFRGSPIVVNSWAVWCPFCTKELPDFARLQGEFGDRIVVVAINRQESLDKVKGYTDGLGITQDMLFLLDPSDSFYKTVGGFSMPETLFIDSAGKIVIHKRGPMELDEMREHVNKILE
ncbi:MAG: TlpA disulfide reductase family protein [Candidatus Colwellbacteria bacterium]